MTNEFIYSYIYIFKQIKLQSITGNNYIIEGHSDVYNKLVNVNNEYVQLPYDNIWFEEIINIKILSIKH